MYELPALALTDEPMGMTTACAQPTPTATTSAHAQANPTEHAKTWAKLTTAIKSAQGALHTARLLLKQSSLHSSTPLLSDKWLKEATDGTETLLAELVVLSIDRDPAQVEVVTKKLFGFHEELERVVRQSAQSAARLAKTGLKI